MWGKLAEPKNAARNYREWLRVREASIQRFCSSSRRGEGQVIGALLDAK
jgi:hypothetical protein